MKFCEGCLFYDGPNSEQLDGYDNRENMTIGSCYRYPKIENKHPTDWCGEWSGINPGHENGIVRKVY